ncbi:MAG: hypothetical protein U9O94_09095, partial [Nanoarchaeota archaeon]|nr:hypothetical protein [Nanoarchaeota archaeon]
EANRAAFEDMAPLVTIAQQRKYLEATQRGGLKFEGGGVDYNMSRKKANIVKALLDNDLASEVHFKAMELYHNGAVLKGRDRSLDLTETWIEDEKINGLIEKLSGMRKGEDQYGSNKDYNREVNKIRKDAVDYYASITNGMALQPYLNDPNVMGKYFKGPVTIKMNAMEDISPLTNIAIGKSPFEQQGYEYARMKFLERLRRKFKEDPSLFE